MKKILVLTGGGPAPALNATIAGVLMQARESGVEVIGGLRGWASLATNEGEIISLENYRDLEALSRIGSTILKTSRTKPTALPDGVDILKRKMAEHHVDGLLPIGGDDTLNAANELSKMGIPLVAAPKTIDNDLGITYWTPGFPTAAWNLMQFTKAVRQHAKAVEKIHLIETFGGHAGWLTAAAYLGGAKIIVPPEKVTNLEALAKKILRQYKQDQYAVVAVSQEARFFPDLPSAIQGKQDQFGHKREYFRVLALRDFLMEKIDAEFKIEIPSYYLMGADPIEKDRLASMELGKLAVATLLKGEFDRMVAIDTKGQAITVWLANAVDKYRNLTEDEFEFENFKPKKILLNYLRQVIS